MRIVSLVPSLTELVIDLALEKELVGRTKFCIHPADKVKSVPKIGGTKNVNIEAVLNLKPDLILANKEENTRQDIEALKKECSVLVTEIANYSQALDSILEIGKLTDRIEKSQQLVIQIELNFSKLPNLEKINKSVCYLIWNEPMMTIGHDTYIHDMLQKCGFKNIYGNQDRYPTINPQELKDRNPDFIFLSSEPFPFKDKHINQFKDICPNSKVVLVNGEFFSWYGSRMLKAAAYFKELIKFL